MSEPVKEPLTFPVVILIATLIIAFCVSILGYFELTSTTYMPSNDETCRNAGYDTSIPTDLYRPVYPLTTNHQMLYNNTVYVHCEKLTMTNGTFKTETGYTPYKTYNKTSDIERILTKGFGRR